MVQGILSGHKEDLFFFMTSSRVFPASPMWLLNICFPHLGIPLSYFMGSYFLGIMPWNYISCSAGVLIAHLTRVEDVLNRENYLFVTAL